MPGIGMVMGLQSGGLGVFFFPSVSGFYLHLNFQQRGFVACVEQFSVTVCAEPVDVERKAALFNAAFPCAHTRCGKLPSGSVHQIGYPPTVYST